ncbi:MAG: FecR domain-containing protein [Marinobacter sp.]|uniref:FecR domain-containing protein n=1 Tax=Marinobacter sp. TaxID=50741 RepID=UPI001B3EE63E|nr:FecR domain-containing protein [Marinobacter sp.]MBQ0747145.1 FecR domain-containing protein [Marinobacter sp.]MBQ0814043.1 FecR domain-containing protein [Marinobacter sp.]|tara:strand:- start:15 stop:1652 length:1638 start_codon:yes stop_codon:yes gene_type:complete
MTEHRTAFVTKAFLLLVLLALGMPVCAELSITRGSATTVASSTRDAAPEWIYTFKPGESFSEIASELLAKNVSAGRLLQYNSIDNSATLGEGDRIRIPLSWLKRQPDPARATSVSGNVQLISGIDGRKKTLTKDTLVRVGDEVLSAEGAATITLADGSEVRLSPNSRLIFNRLTQYGKSGMIDTRLRLNRGEVHTRVKPVIEGGARFEIETPSAVAAVRGTAFSLQTGPEGTSLQVTEGVVDFGAPNRTQRIPAGYSATVASNSTSELSIRRMPPAPEINPLPPVLTQLPAEMTWKREPATNYRLDIFETESGRWVESREINDSRFDISRLDNGQYEIHLAAFDAQGMAGMPGILPIEVDLQARTANLLEPENEGSVNDDMPEFRWTLNGENEVARVEIAEDEAFGNLVATSEWAPGTTALPSRPLSPGQYYWRVVTEAGGNSVATTQPRKLIVNGTLPPVRIISINYVNSQVRVFWEKVDTATNYRMQLAEEPGFNNIIKEATLPDTTAALRLIPGRRYFVRLKALSDSLLQSRWGPGRELYLE